VELVRKTTILFPPDLHRHLCRIARQRRVSMGRLVREACEARYGGVSAEERLEAARELALLALPVGSVASMKRESTPRPKDLVR